MFRDNLGLSTVEIWRDYDFKKIKRDGGDLKRFKSPLLFKPVLVGGCWRVYLLHREIPQKYKDNTFSVNESIKFKTFDNFSMKNYLNYVLADIENYNRYVTANGKDARERMNNIIKDLNGIKKNFKKISD